MMRTVSVVFTGFNPEALLEMDLEDLAWWYRQAEQLTREIQRNG